VPAEDMLLRATGRRREVVRIEAAVARWGVCQRVVARCAAGGAYLLVVAAVAFLVVLDVLDLVLAAVCRP
jgi:hypothetical protein